MRSHRESRPGAGGGAAGAPDPRLTRDSLAAASPRQAAGARGACGGRAGGAPARAGPLVTVVVLTALAGVAAAEPAKEPPKGGALFDAGSFGNKKEPIVITSDTLEYDYKTNVVVYRGDVLAAQGETKVRSDTLTVTLAAQKDSDPPDTGKKGDQRLQEVIAVGNVRIDNGTRWATGGRAVFEQATRTLVLTENPVLHDGANEVSGDLVTLYLDENRSVVDGGRRRVKATVFPNKDGGLASANAAPPKDAAPSPQAAAGGGGDATP
jgi:lipopolysaccharide export system protein LptA